MYHKQVSGFSLRLNILKPTTDKATRNVKTSNEKPETEEPETINVNNRRNITKSPGA